MTGRKRSRTKKAARLSASNPSRSATRCDAPGGRQGVLPLAGAGGGYQDCWSSPSSAVGRWRAAGRGDPRIEELRRVGIGRVWVRLAEVLGFEVFVQAWQVLASDDSVLDERSRVLVPSPARYQRYQRNQMILELNAAGRDAGEIAKTVGQLLGEPITKQRVQRLLRQRAEDFEDARKEGEGGGR